MPFELIILLGAAGVGVLLCVVLFCINRAVSEKIARASVSEEDAYEDEFDEEAGDDGVDAEALPEPLPGNRKDPFADRRTDASDKNEFGEPETPEPPVQEPVQAPEDALVASIGQFSVRVDNAQMLGTRGEQQDAFAITSLEDPSILREHGVMAVVCDGMGGLKGGARAANIAAVQFMRSYLRGTGVNEDSLRNALLFANRDVCAFAREIGEKVGTTLAAAALDQDGMWFISAGDSHIYLHRNGKLYQLNRDHNYYSVLLKQVENGSLTLEEARSHPERSHLTSFLGQERPASVDVNVQPIRMRAGDKIVLCTDGLFKTVPAREVQEILSRNGQNAAQALVEAVERINKTNQDNATIVVLYLDQV